MFRLESAFTVREDRFYQIVIRSVLDDNCCQTHRNWLISGFLRTRLSDPETACEYSTLFSSRLSGHVNLY